MGISSGLQVFIDGSLHQTTIFIEGLHPEDEPNGKNRLPFFFFAGAIIVPASAAIDTSN